MARDHRKKLASPVTLFAAVEAAQHEALRTLAFQERRSLADIVREAIDTYLRLRRQPGSRRAARG